MDQINLIEEIRSRNLNTLNMEYPDLMKELNRLINISHQLCELYDSSNDISRITGIIFAKGVLNSKAVYSTILDGHGQEAGAILRNIIETIEILKYIR